MTEITMPRLSDQMEQGTIVSWLVEDGATVTVGQEICEIETDKATAPYEAQVEGTLAIVAPVGSTLAVGEPIARIGTAAPAPEPAAEPARSAEDAAPDGAATVEPPAAGSAEPARDREPALAGVAAGNGHRRVTPLARRAAGVHGFDLDAVDGTGPRGRVTKTDVLRAAGVEIAEEEPAFTAPAPERPAAPAATPAPPAKESPEGGAKGTSTIQEPTRLQQIVARRVAEAKATVPHFQVQTEVAFDAALALRAQLKQAAAETDAVPSVNDLIVRACALALRDHPLVNGSYKDGAYELHARVNVGIAVASDDGLVVATVPDADIRSLGEIARESRRLAQRVRDKTITAPELAGQTFTVSNLGMYGMTAITAVINPPQAAILGVGAARPTLARDPDTGDIVDRHLLTLTLSCDHRILNGADGSRYLADVKQRLENPLRLAL